MSISKSTIQYNINFFEYKGSKHFKIPTSSVILLNLIQRHLKHYPLYLTKIQHTSML